MKTRKSISHLTGKEQTTLHEIKKQVVKMVQPLIIYCYGSELSTTITRSCFTTPVREESWQFSCALLVVVPDNHELPATIATEIAEATAQWGRVTVRVHTHEVVSRHLHDENLFFSWVHKFAMLLYEQNGATAKLPPQINKRAEYQQQAFQFYIANPEMPSYLTEKLAPIVQEIPVQSTGTPPKPIELRLFLYLKDGKLEQATTGS